MPRTYDLIVCLECGEPAMPWHPLWPKVCKDGGRHGPTQAVTATDDRDVEPLVEAARSVLGHRVNLATARYLPDNPIVRGKLDGLAAALSAFDQEREDG